MLPQKSILIVAPALASGDRFVQVVFSAKEMWLQVVVVVVVVKKLSSSQLIPAPFAKVLPSIVTLL